MNILHVMPSLTVQCAGMVAGMNGMIEMGLLSGNTGHVLAIEDGDSMMAAAAACTVLPPSFPGRFGNSGNAVSWLQTHVRDYDAVVIHSVWLLVNIRVAQVLRRHGRPYVVVAHGSLDPFDLRKRRLAKRFLGPLLIRPFLAGSWAVVCMAQREADCLVTYGAECRTVVLPCPVEEAACESSREEARQALGLRDDEFVALFLGRIDYKKGFPVLIPAFKRLAGSRVKARLLVVGPDSGGYAAAVRKLVERLDLGGHVTFYPPKVGAEKMRLMHAADCFVLPSLNENLARAAVEAMQQGLPVIISDNVYISDRVQRSGAGIVVKYDVTEVFTALLDLAQDKEKRSAMAEAAGRLGREFSPEALRGQYLSFFTGLAEASRQDATAPPPRCAPL